MKRLAIMLIMSLLAVSGRAFAADDVDVTVGQKTINMDLFYNGISIPVEGSVPEGSQAVVRFTGKIGEATMKRKGKAMGLLWMNMNTLHFSNMPTVCLVDSSTPLSALGQAGEKLALAGVAESVVIEPAGSDREMLLKELLKLKKSEGLYREDADAVKLKGAQNGRQAFSVQMHIPSRLSPGGYSVEVFAIKDGAVIGQSVKPVEARLAGAPAFIANLAFNHGAWYGVLASLIAILAGLAVGFIFQSKGAH
jgi:hypothetical protein